MRRPSSPTWAIVAGGGTAGGTLPGVAVAQALVKRGHDPATIHFVGSRRGQEAKLVGDAGFSITLLPGRGVARRLTLANVGAVLGILGGMLRALAIVARRRPAVVVSVGQYASVPCAVAAVVLRVPLVLVAADAVPGASLRIVGRFAAASAVALEGTPLPRAVVTGSPVRPEIQAVDRSPGAKEAARRELSIPADRAVVGVFGGSLGARHINETVLDLVERWQGRADVAVRHAIGRRDWPVLQAKLPVPPPDGLAYQAVEYEDRMPLLLAAADVMVTRAGGSTVAELTVAGVPAVLVPLPGAPGDHQTANARVLERAGAAVLLADADLGVDRLDAVLAPLLADRERLGVMAKASSALGRRDAADAVADVVERHARH
ncbi:MAG: UDP-N-acetylglucosamine--N-acetylmuramyl-(pentapeptide) pyrophosphoryl-undecaprenol [Acidimicrobiaceae bacterium]|nr:UDP-N-acetylglucosamine--N-acetylmuramyl-(pentapeptide) pyrophosphoryl-undecaprenol [Acidimicrobiaceae bacterium]